MTTPHDGFTRLPLDVRRYNIDGCRVLALAGECDLASRDMLRDGLVDALTDTPRLLIVDLAQLSFCDGHGAALILIAAQTSRLALAGLAGTPRLVFDVLDPANEVPRYPTVNDAADDPAAPA